MRFLALIVLGIVFVGGEDDGEGETGRIYFQMSRLTVQSEPLQLGIGLPESHNITETELLMVLFYAFLNHICSAIRLHNACISSILAYKYT